MDHARTGTGNALLRLAVTEIPIYQPTTLNLKINIHTQPIDERPLVELEPTDHPLAAEQRAGITLARVQQIAEELLHSRT